MMLPDPSLAWPIPLPAVALIAEFEDLRLKAYRCPAGIPTIGWGETDGVRMGDTCTKEQADQWLLEDLQDRSQQVRALCKVEPSPSELGAMVSLAYNIGMGWKGKVKPSGAKDGFQQSTVLRQHNAGNRQASARAFGLWNKARVNGVLTDLPGLTARRAREAALYLSGDEAVQPMPQAVEAESKLTTSPIAQAGTVTAGAGVIGVLAQVGDQVSAVKGVLATVRGLIVDTLGVPPDWVLPALMIGVGVVVVRYRRLQRNGGHA